MKLSSRVQRWTRARWALLPIGVVVVVAFTSNPPERTTWDSVYSAPQALRGESLYVRSCARCHKASLSGADESPPLAGGGFLGGWNGLPLSNLEERIRTTMPPDSIGVVERQAVTDIIAYLLKANAFPSGQTDLSSEKDSLSMIMLRVARP